MTDSPSRDPIQLAFELHRSGRAAEAEPLFRSALAREPRNPQALHGLGATLQALGRHGEALACAREAVRCAPAHPGLHYNLGVMLQEQGAIGGARAAFARAAELKPDFVQAWNNLGLALQDLGRLDEATNAFDRALDLQPDYAAALHNLANLLLFSDRPAEALTVLRRLRALDPSQETLRRKEAAALLQLGRRDEAMAALGADLESLARLYMQLNDADGARDCYRRLAEPSPAHWLAQIEARLALPAVADSAEAMARSRERFCTGLAELLGLTEHLPAEPAQVLRAVERDNFFLAYQGEDDRALQVDYARLVARLLEALAPEGPAMPVRPRAGRIRVGFASAFFRDCTAGQYFKAWITDLDPARFETFVYVLGGPEDGVTQQMRAAAAHFARLEQALPEAAARIRGDALDVLIFPELGMSGRCYALAALRMAPVQCAAWGHPVTSGHASIDYAFSCASMEPADAQQHYAERLLLLPGLGTRYDKPAVGTAFTRTDFALPEQAHLYLFPHSPFKIHPDNDATLARILAADPQGMLVLFEGESRAMTSALLARLREHGVAAGRIRVLPTMPRATYLEVNRLCDVMLDACRWSGGNTTLDAVAAGLPLVTRRGRLMRGRQSAGMLTAMGLTELIAEDEAAYVALALRLAGDRAYRAHIVRRMAEAEGEIFGDARPIRALERLLSTIVQQP